MSILIEALSEWAGKVVGIFLLLAMLVTLLGLLWDALSALRNWWNGWKKRGIARRIRCAIGLHSYGPWDDVLCYSWRTCSHCGRRDEINRSYM